MTDSHYQISNAQGKFDQTSIECAFTSKSKDVQGENVGRYQACCYGE